MCESELFESSEWKQSLLMKKTSDVDLLLKCCCHAVADSPSRKALVSSGGDIVRDSRLADFMSDISFSTSPFLAMIALSTSATWKYFNMSWRKYLDPISDSSCCSKILVTGVSKKDSKDLKLRLNFEMFLDTLYFRTPPYILYFTLQLATFLPI